jgi:hypothetical protein
MNNGSLGLPEKKNENSSIIGLYNRFGIYYFSCISITTKQNCICVGKILGRRHRQCKFTYTVSTGSQ